jgi:hypothetical protein
MEYTYGDFRDPLARELYLEYLEEYRAEGCGSPDQEELAHENVEEAYEIMATRGELDAEPDPEWLFRAAEQSPAMAEYLHAARAEGATDANIRYWHGLPFLRRALYEYLWELDCADDSFWDDPTLPILERTEATPAPAFRAPVAPIKPWLSPDPLPAELYPRYLEWRKRYPIPREQLEFRVIRVGTFNKFLRLEVQAGRM